MTGHGKGSRAREVLTDGPLLPLTLILVILAAVGAGSTLVIQREITTMLVFVVMVVGLYTFSGTTGVLSFGHTAFILIGAYCGFLVTVPALQKKFLIPDVPSWLQSAELSQPVAALVCGAVATIVGALVSVPVSRLSGIACALALFTLLLSLNIVAINWESVTRGTLGVFGVPRNTTLWVALVYAVISVCAAYWFKESRLGLRLRAARDEPIAASAIGANLSRDRQAALIFSAFWMGVGGFLYAQFLGAFSPTTFFLQLTFVSLAMLVIGGWYSLSGAVLGVLLVSILQTLLRSVETSSGRAGLSAVALAVLMLIALVVRPSGLTGGRELTPRAVGDHLRRWRERGGDSRPPRLKSRQTDTKAPERADDDRATNVQL